MVWACRHPQLQPELRSEPVVIHKNKKKKKKEEEEEEKIRREEEGGGEKKKKKTAVLTSSLPWCHLKTTDKSAKFKTLKLFVFVFATGLWKVFIKVHSIENRCRAVGPDNILLSGASVHLTARKFYMLWKWRG